MFHSKLLLILLKIEKLIISTIFCKIVVVGGELVSSLTTTFSLAGSSSTKQGQLLLNKTRLGYEASYHVFLIRLLSYKCYDVECLIHY